MMLLIPDLIFCTANFETDIFQNVMKKLLQNNRRDLDFRKIWIPVEG